MNICKKTMIKDDEKTKKQKNILLIIFTAAVVYGGLLLMLFTPSRKYSDTERRALAQMPKLTLEEVSNGKFMDKFEKYSLDQFPARDAFRKIKALNKNYVFAQKDNNGFYKAKGYIAKLEYPYNEARQTDSLKKQQTIYSKYIEGTNCKVYTSVIPDKGYYLGPETGSLYMDYDKYVKKLVEAETYATYIDIFGELDLECYYMTDPHWRQEKILPVSKKINVTMGNGYGSDYEIIELPVEFYGAYYNQACIPARADKISYLSNDSIENCTIEYVENEKLTKVYDLEKAYAKDPYEIYLSGAQAIVTIENDNSDSRKELIMFRDSFGSSLAPLFIESYSKITLVDIRYINIEKIEEFIDFNKQDVLFIYSTLTF